MIEVSLAEIGLFIWAVGATAGWLYTSEELRGAKRFLRAIIEDKDIRDKIVDEYEQFKRKTS